MPTPAPTAAAPAAVPAAPVTPAPVTPPVTPPVPDVPGKDVKASGRGSRIFSLLAEESASEPGKKREPKTAPAEPAAPAAVAPATPAAPGDTPIKATKKPAISKRPAPPAPVSAAAPVAVAPVVPKTEDEWEANLIPEEKSLLEDAADAESHLPNRKGLKDQTRKFIKERQAMLEKHPELNGDKDDPETAEANAAYQKWMKSHRPALSETEQRTITEGRIASRVAKPFEQKTQDLEHQLFVRDEEPKIAQQGQRITSDLNTNAMPKEILEFAGKHGVDLAKKEYADELKIHNTIVNAAASDFQELVRLGTNNPKTGRPLAVPVIDPAKDPEKHTQHQRLEKIIGKVNDDFVAEGKDLQRDGKWFCTREEWLSGYRNHPDKYWTFTNQEIAQRALAWVPGAIDSTIKQHRQEMEGRGWQRRAFTPAPVAPAAVPAVPTSSAPGPGTSPVPAPSGTPPAANSPGSRLANALSAG